MKNLLKTISTTFLKRRTILFLNYFVILTSVFAGLSSCKKTTDPTPTSPAASSIMYKTFVADSVNFTADSLFFDVNNDGINDIKVTMQHIPNGGIMNYSGSISAVNNNMSFCYMKTSPTLTMLAVNEIINSTTSLNWMPVASYSGSSSFTSGSNFWAQGIFTNYFGFRITLNSRNYYGWFHFKWQTITETGMNLTSDESIKVGQKQ